MKFLERVTITGADDFVKPSDLVKLVERFPFLELAILLRDGEPKNRYPSTDWQHILRLAWSYNPDQYKLAGHICGRWVREICKGDWTAFQNSHFKDLSVMFERIQLNFSPYINDMNVDDFLNGLDREELYFKKFIFQVNDVESKKFDELIDKATKEDYDFGILFDSSGGRGKLPKDWATGVDGYAGGLNPDNLAEQLKLISESADTTKKCWIDVESGVRTDDKFDFAKTTSFLEIAESWVQ